jgi:predicted enzyme related to lactoylglutathione lyase
VTPDVASVCAIYGQLYGVTFSEPVAELGNARTADLPNGGRLGVRAPLRKTEQPVVRPYLLVDDVAAAVKKAEAAGATIAVPPMELAGQGTFAIYVQGGIEHGLWQR